MTETVSCGGVVIHKGKVLLLYKNQSGKSIGWVLPKGTVEENESFRQTAVREVHEEARVYAKVLKAIGTTQYSFKTAQDVIFKTVHWYLMTSQSFHCKPLLEEHFADAGFYKKHEAYHLLRYNDEKQIIIKAYEEYDQIRSRPRPKSGSRRSVSTPIPVPVPHIKANQQ